MTFECDGPGHTPSMQGVCLINLKKAAFSHAVGAKEAA